MPAPQAALMKQAARAKFMSFNLKVPDKWQRPQGVEGEQYDRAFKPSERVTSPAVPALFQPHTLNKYHTDTQKMLTATYGSFLDAACEAICSAWSEWQSTALLVGVVINGPIATGGQVTGPPLAPLILAKAQTSSRSALKYWNAIANVIGTAWLTYTSSIKVPRIGRSIGDRRGTARG